VEVESKFNEIDTVLYNETETLIDVPNHENISQNEIIQKDERRQDDIIEVIQQDLNTVKEENVEEDKISIEIKNNNIENTELNEGSEILLESISKLEGILRRNSEVETLRRNSEVEILRRNSEVETLRRNSEVEMGGGGQNIFSPHEEKLHSARRQLSCDLSADPDEKGVKKLDNKTCHETRDKDSPNKKIHKKIKIKVTINEQDSQESEKRLKNFQTLVNKQKTQKISPTTTIPTQNKPSAKPLTMFL